MHSLQYKEVAIGALNAVKEVQPLQTKSVAIGALNAVKEVQPLQYKEVAIGALNAVKEVQTLYPKMPPNNVFNSPIIGISYTFIYAFAFS